MNTLSRLLPRVGRPPQVAGGPGIGWLFLALVPVYLLLAASLPPAEDELYYWCWAEQLQLSYYDHPLMTALLIRASTAVLGDTLFAVRLPAVVASLVVLGVIARLTRPRTLLPFVVFTPLFTLGAVLITPDTPLLLFWSLYLLWLVNVHERLAKDGPLPLWLWALGGVALGCGILGKYTTGLAVMGGFLSFVLAGNWRRWAAGYTLHLAVAFVVTLPILVHNVRHDFVPLLYQWGHSMGSPKPGVKSFAEFVGIQALLFGFLPFVVFAWAVRNWRELAADPRLRPCLCLFAFPFAFFLFKATRGPLEGNWALACYIAVWPLAAVWYERVRGAAAWRRLTAAGFLVPAACVVLLAVHLTYPLPVISPEADRVTRGAAKYALWSEAAPKLTELAAGDPVFLPDYQGTAVLRFRGVDARQIDGVTRPSHFTQTPEDINARPRLVVFSEGFLPPEMVTAFGPPKILAGFPLYVRGKLVTGFWLIEYTKPTG